MLKPGEYAYGKLNSERVRILAVSEVRGFVSYKVRHLPELSVSMEWLHSFPGIHAWKLWR
jgi:hypothetical protein